MCNRPAEAITRHCANMMSLALHRIPLAGRLVRPWLKRGTFIRNETWQAHELTTTLAILDAEGVDGAFIWTSPAGASMTSSGSSCYGTCLRMPSRTVPQSQAPG